MIVRRATQADTEQIVAMGLEFFAATPYAQFANCDETSIAVLAKMMRDTGILLVSEVDGVVTGMVGLVVAPFAFNHALRSAHEVMWWVDPSFRDTGAGIALLRAIEPEARAMGCIAVQMMTLSNSPPQAEALYGRLGYTHTETSFYKGL